MSLWLEAEVCRLTGRWGGGAFCRPGGRSRRIWPNVSWNFAACKKARGSSLRASRLLGALPSSAPAGRPRLGCRRERSFFCSFCFGSQIKMFFFLSGHGGACWLMHVFSNSVVLWLQKARPWCCWCPVTRVRHRASGALVPRGHTCQRWHPAPRRALGTKLDFISVKQENSR